MQATIIVAVFALLCTASTVAQQAAKPYDLDEAYQVYSALIPSEASFRSAKGTLVIQEETATLCASKSCGPKSVPSLLPCLTDEAAETFKDAVNNFIHVNSYRWVLRRQFDIEKPYQLVTEDILMNFFTPCCDWHRYYEQYPDSGGYMIFAAVGFNSDKTKAIVYSGSSYGYGGRWNFHLLKKVNEKWTAVNGLRCTPGLACGMVEKP